MAWRGITAIVSGEKIIRICPRVGNPKIPTWTKTTVFDKDDKGLPTKEWKMLESDPSNISGIIKGFKRNIEIIPVETIRVNGNVLNTKDLFGTKDIVFCVLGVEKNKESDLKNVRSLFLVSNKTSKEMVLAGYTKKKESYLPLFLGIINGKTAVLNSI